VGKVNRAAGMIRSLAIYHAIPRRQRRLRGFYSQFVSRGDLVFDLGAHAGNRTRAFAAMGCRVVAVEPQPDFVRLLRMLSATSPRVEVVAGAVGEKPGRTSLLISERTPTVTTIARAWHDARAREPDFSGVAWDREIEVDITTLDLLIERFGMPAFVKIDVEGAEPIVLAGLSRPLRALSFEYLPRALDYARVCVDRLGALGKYSYNWSSGESYRLEEDAWMTGPALCRALESPGAQRRPGDVYARLDDA
jgi:FkbM family methyltransferase